MGIVCVFARTGSAFTALLAISALSGSVQAQTPDISGTYWAAEYHAKIQLVGGGDLPLTPKGKAEYEKNMAGLKDGSLTDAARKFCVPDGLPRVLASPYPFEIIQAPPGQVTIIHELNHQVRVVAMDKVMPTVRELSTMERIRRISPTQLEDVITIHDPQYYTRDLQARFVYTLRNDVRLEDYVCGEPHRDLSSVAGVRRP